MRFFWLVPAAILSAQPAFAKCQGSRCRPPAGKSPGIHRSSDFADSIGANTHLAFKDMASSNLAYIEQDLFYLGISRIRDASIGVVPEYEALARKGIRLNFTWFYGSLADFVAQAMQVELACPQAIVSIEGPNEADIGNYTYRGLSGPFAANAAQKDLHAAVKHNSILAGIPLIVWSLAHSKNAWRQGNLARHADYGNLHDYFFDFTRPIPPQLDAKMHEVGSVVTPGLPVISTETGYSTAFLDKSGYGISYRAQARLLVNTLLDHTLAGVKATYIYELIDDHPDPGRNNLEHEFGVFDAQNRPKPAATALRNLLVLLRDGGADAKTFKLRQLNYALSDMPSTGNSLAFQKSDGTFYIVLWNESVIWDSATRQDITAPSSTVTLKLDQEASAVSVYDPFQDVAPVATYDNTSRVQLTISDHAIVALVHE